MSCNPSVQWRAWVYSIRGILGSPGILQSATYSSQTPARGSIPTRASSLFSHLYHFEEDCDIGCVGLVWPRSANWAKLRRKGGQKADKNHVAESIRSLTRMRLLLVLVVSKPHKRQAKY
jgi:hypothetical protein